MRTSPYLDRPLRSERRAKIDIKATELVAIWEKQNHKSADWPTRYHCWMEARSQIDDRQQLKDERQLNRDEILAKAEHLFRGLTAKRNEGKDHG